MLEFRSQLQCRGFSGLWDFAPIGCVFSLLLMFLLLQSYLAPVPGVPVELPVVESGTSVAGPDWQVLVVDREGRLFFRQQLMTAEALEGELARLVKASPGQPLLVIQADRSLDLGRLAEVYALCRRAGVARLKLQTRPNIGLPAPPRSHP
jgi:biopolymer transport protein ExbD